jgi:hypothetical protein
MAISLADLLAAARRRTFFDPGQSILSNCSLSRGCHFSRPLAISSTELDLSISRVPDADPPVAMTTRWITSPLLMLAAAFMRATLGRATSSYSQRFSGALPLKKSKKETVMLQIRGFSLGALAIAATAMIAATAPSSARAETSAHARHARLHRATHLAARRSHDANDRAYGEYGAGPANAYGAMPGGPVYVSPSYPGYGYGIGDNSDSYAQ